MKQTRTLLAGVKVGIGPAEAEDGGPPSWQLQIWDGLTDEEGNAIGDGELIIVLLDEQAVAFLHEQTERGSKVVLPGKPAVTVVHGRLPRT